MNSTPNNKKPYVFELPQSGSAILPHDEAAYSLTPEPSLTLTNSSFSFNSASTSSCHRDRDCDRDASINLPLVGTQSSLLDLERDESIDSPENDDDILSLDNNVEYHSTVTHEPLESEGVSFMEQTENSLVNITESLTGSFCMQGEINNTCHVSECCVSIDQNDESNKSRNNDKIVRNRLMNDFNFFLGSDTTPCREERDIFCNCFFTSPSNEFEYEAELGSSRIRNRAGESWRARAYRIKQLRESRNIQELSGGWGTDQNPGIRQSYSMDGQGSRVKTSQNSRDLHPTQRLRGKQFKPEHEINADPLGCIIGDCIEPISKCEGDENELEVVWKQQQHEDLLGEDLCYDSDPGESSCRNFNTDISSNVEQRPNSDDITKSNLNRSQAEDEEENENRSKDLSVIPLKRRRKMHFDSILEANSDEDSLYDDCTENSANNNEANSILSEDNRFLVDEKQDSSEDYSCDDKHIYADDNLFWDGGSSVFHTKNSNLSGWERDMIRNIQDALNRTWTLTWHPTSGDFPHESATSKSSNFRSPLRTIQTNPIKYTDVSAMPPRCIQLWFERGNRIRRNDIVEPKLMWREAYHPDLASRRKLNSSSTQGPHQVCLLSICRILEVADTVDRKKYPFAKKSCSFLIRTCDDTEYMFEASSEEIRERILHQWKLVVARLASQAVVGDGEGMVGEFFVPTSFSVP